VSDLENVDHSTEKLKHRHACCRRHTCTPARRHQLRSSSLETRRRLGTRPRYACVKSCSFEEIPSILDVPVMHNLIRIYWIVGMYRARSYFQPVSSWSHGLFCASRLRPQDSRGRPKSTQGRIIGCHKICAQEVDTCLDMLYCYCDAEAPALGGLCI